MDGLGRHGGQVLPLDTRPGRGGPPSGPTRSHLLPISGLRLASAGTAALGALLAAALLAGLGSAAGAEHFVDDDLGCGGRAPCYQRIQEAVDAAHDGDVVSIAAGIYPEAVLVVDKALSFEGPGVGDALAADDPTVHALWSQPAGPIAAALTFDARDRDLAAPRVSGLRFFSISTGVRLVSRQPSAVAGGPADPPASTQAASIVGARIDGNLFRGHPQPQASRAVEASFTLSTTIEGNRLERAGLLLSGGGGHRIDANEVINAPGPALDLDLDGPPTVVLGNTIDSPGGPGIRIAPGGALTRTAHAQSVLLQDNIVVDAAAEGILARAADGHLDQLVVRGLVVMGSGAGLRAEALEHLSMTAVTVTSCAGPGIELRDVAEATLQRSRIVWNAGGGVRLVETSGTSTRVTLGGAPGLGNRLSGNTGPQLALVNETGTSVSTSDVLATHNDWGTADRSRIEDGIRHRPDDILLGLVTYIPAATAVHAARLSADPPSIVADGQSRATLTLHALDVDGRPVADDTLVTFALDGGTLLRPDGAVQAESERVRRRGEWVESQAEQYGPFEGAGYLRSDVAGSALALDFDTPAVLVRYAQSVIHGGTATVALDGEALSPFDTLGPEAGWVDRLLARGLGPGPHTVTVTLAAGELAIDLLAVGTTSQGGLATAGLVSSPAVGFGRVAARAYGANGTRDASLDLPYTAGQPARLTMTLGARDLPVGGFTTTLTVRATDALGRPVADGTELRLSTARGTIHPHAVTTAGGNATTVYRSPDTPGTDTLRAESGAAYELATIEIRPGPPATVSIAASRQSLPANSTSAAELTVTVRDALANPVSDGTPVTLTTTLGTLEPGPLAATNRGVAQARLRAGREPGRADLVAFSGPAQATASLAIVGTDLRLTKVVEPVTAVVPGERVTYTLSYHNASIGPVYDLVLEDVVPTGLISPVVRTPPGQMLERLDDRPMGFRLARLDAGQRGDIVIGFRIDTARAWGQRTVVANAAGIASELASEATPLDNAASAEVLVLPGAVHTVTLTAPPVVVAGGATAAIRAELTDRFGNPARDGTGVSFLADLGSIEPTSTTTRDGVAHAVFTSGRQAGQATIRAVTPDERGAAARLAVAPGPPSSLYLQAGRPWLVVGGASTVVTATVTDMYGNGAPAEVMFDTDHGLLSGRQVQAAPTGIATTTLRSGVLVETACVEARCDGLARQLEVPFRAGPPAGIDLRLDRRRLALGDSATATAYVFDVFGNAVPDIRVAFHSTFVDLRHPWVDTDRAGVARNAFHAPRPGTGVVTASAGLYTSERSLTVGVWTAYLPLAIP